MKMPMDTNCAHRRFVLTLLALCFVLLGGEAKAQQEPGPATGTTATGETANPRPFLWRIDGRVPSYLFGTIHLPDERVTDVHPEVDRALAESDAVFAELEMDMAASPKMMQSMRLPDGKTLRDVLPAEVLRRTSQRIGSDVGPTQIRPWVLSMQVMLSGKKGSGTPLDLVLYKDAKSAGKEVGGLETFEEQMAAFDGLGHEDEARLLEITLDLLDDYEKRGQDLMEEMIVAYCAGDTQRTLAFFEAMGGKGSVWAQLSRTLLTDRNLRMAERIDRMLHGTPQRRFVFAVGTGHLIGDTNVVDLLRARGYTVTRVPESAANLDEELEGLQKDMARQQARIDWLRARRAALTEAARKKAG